MKKKSTAQQNYSIHTKSKLLDSWLHLVCLQQLKGLKRTKMSLKSIPTLSMRLLR